VAYRLPDFGLTCNVFTGGPVPPILPPRLSPPCNLAYGKRVSLSGFPTTFFNPNVAYPSQLLLPKLTDVRGPQNGTGPDVIEVPAGSGRWYGVLRVEDLGKGYSNEHRMCLIQPVGTWPTPIP